MATFWDFASQGWSMLGVVGTVVFGVIAWFQYNQAQKRKELSYHIISNVLLLNRINEVKDKVTLRVGDEVVMDVRLIEVLIINTGDIAIRASDFDQKLTITFGEKSRILTAETTSKSHDALNVNILHEETKLEIEPLLLNANDYFLLKVLVTRFEETTVFARVEDIQSISSLNKLRQEKVNIVSNVQIVSTIVAFVGMFSSVFLSQLPGPFWKNWFVLVMAFFPLSLFLINVWSKKQISKFVDLIETG